MEETYVWAVIALLAAATLVSRMSFIAFSAHLRLPPLLRRALAYLAPAILAAIIVDQVFPATAAGPSLDLPRLGAALLALAVAWRTRSTMATIGTGMLALWALQALLR